ncbi:MAG TPA: hypothetical protein DEG71_04585 [Clostridiales bacterium]|nr:hypothetical protein [Clostridiales bacterium]
MKKNMDFPGEILFFEEIDYDNIDSPIREPWEFNKYEEIGLIKVRVSDIIEYPDALGGNTCIHLNKAKQLGIYIPGSKYSMKSIKQVLEESSQSTENINECLNSYCGGLYEILIGKRKIKNINDNVVLAEYKGKYYPYGNGHHRICIAKRANIEYIEAEVIRYYDE